MAAVRTESVNYGSQGNRYYYLKTIDGLAIQHTRVYVIQSSLLNQTCFCVANDTILLTSARVLRNSLLIVGGFCAAQDTVKALDAYSSLLS